VKVFVLNRMCIICDEYQPESKGVSAVRFID